MTYDSVNVHPRLVKPIERLSNDRPGWQYEVDTDKLDMTNGEKCVLGQLYDGYWNAPSKVKYSNVANETGSSAFDTLTGHWQDYINDYVRRNPPGSVVSNDKVIIKFSEDGYEDFECKESDLAVVKTVLKHLIEQGAIYGFNAYKEL